VRTSNPTKGKEIKNEEKKEQKERKRRNTMKHENMEERKRII
jgi:hypothetical protein